MTPEDVKNYYETGYRFNKMTKMSASTYFNWLEWGFVPIVAQIKLEKLTNGALKASLKDHL